MSCQECRAKPPASSSLLPCPFQCGEVPSLPMPVDICEAVENCGSAVDASEKLSVPPGVAVVTPELVPMDIANWWVAPMTVVITACVSVETGGSAGNVRKLGVPPGVLVVVPMSVLVVM